MVSAERRADARPFWRLRDSVKKEAEEYCLKAIEIARKHHAKSLELRAVLCINRLLQQQSKPQEVHNLLLDSYHRFTEGFDTKCLQEAKALLAALDRQ